MRAVLFLLLFAGAASAEPATWRFSWEGEGGYALRGALRYDTAETGRIVRETDLSCFVIEGMRDEVPVGRWALTELTNETTWRLHFDAEAGAFLVEGDGAWMPQAWNMDGTGDDCGPDGFGFNIGNAAQDLCLDNRLVVASQVDPFRPFPAVRDDKAELPGDACYAPPLLGGLSMDRSQG